MQETWEAWVRSLDWEDPLEEGMATHSSILTWRIPWTEEPGGLQSMGPQRVGHTEVTSHAHTPHPYPACQPSAHPPPLPHHLPGTIQPSYTRSNPSPCFCSFPLPGKSPSPCCAHGNSYSHVQLPCKGFLPWDPFPVASQESEQPLPLYNQDTLQTGLAHKAMVSATCSH